MSYKIEKAPVKMLNTARGKKRTDYPLTKLKVGEMFKAPSSKRVSIYNAIKHRRNYTGEIRGWKFFIKSIDKETIAVIRIL